MKHVFALALGLSLGAALPAAAEPANLLGVFGNWTAYSSGSGSSLTCFALSKPRASRPATAKRAAVYLMVSDWPSRKIKNEAQIVYGYQASERARRRWAWAAISSPSSSATMARKAVPGCDS